MTRFLKATTYAAIAIAAAAASLPHEAAAGTLDEGEGVVTQLGEHASAMTYWTRGPQGWEVVTTIDPLAGDESGNDGHAILRFTSQLLPGQSQTISVPAVVGAQHPSLLIRRVADRIEVETAPALSN